MSLSTIFRIAFANNFNINMPTRDALFQYDKYIEMLEKRIKALEDKNE
jgi:hypothetical protein